MAHTRLMLAPVRTCGKTRRHYTQEAALAHLAQLRSLEDKCFPTRPPLTIYYCETCQAFHVGHVVT